MPIAYADRRSIPACAGEPELPSTQNITRRVYPRVCGGTRHAALRVDGGRGLSPRVRGNRLVPCDMEDASGSIPACAGEPGPDSLAAFCPPVYPRVCGGTRQLMHPDYGLDGLSPRVRGNLRSLRRPPYFTRSIPACAGEPAPGTGNTPAMRVYPRVCGGTCTKASCAWGVCGLSPRVRGNRVSIRDVTPSHGSIPACAGEPTVASAFTPPVMVYPRVCGGTLRRSLAPRGRQGLSPRVRGNPSNQTRGEQWERSIPACAGEPML